MDFFLIAIVMWFAYRYMTQKAATQASGNGNTRLTPPTDTYRTDFAALADEVNIYREAYAEKAREAGINPRALYDSWLIVGESYEEARIEALQKNYQGALAGMRSAVAAAKSKAEGPLPSELLVPSL